SMSSDAKKKMETMLRVQDAILETGSGGYAVNQQRPPNGIPLPEYAEPIPEAVRQQIQEIEKRLPGVWFLVEEKRGCQMLSLYFAEQDSWYTFRAWKGEEVVPLLIG